MLRKKEDIEPDGHTKIARLGSVSRVCGCRVRVWVSYRTYRSSGLGYKTLTELTEVPGRVARAYRTHRSSRQV